MALSVLNNRDLYCNIMSYVPLSDYEKKLKKNIINELKYKYCEWSSQNNYCYICMSHHPLVIKKYKRTMMCNECCSIVKQLFLGM
jgi:hypothetical protein